MKDDEKKNFGWVLAWVVVPTLVAGGAVGVAVKGGAPGLVTGVATLLGTAFVMWRRFGS